MKRILIFISLISFSFLTGCGLHTTPSRTSHTSNTTAKPNPMRELVKKKERLANSIQGRTVRYLYSTFGTPDKVETVRGYKNYIYHIIENTPYGQLDCSCRFIEVPSSNPPFIGTVFFRDLNY